MARSYPTAGASSTSEYPSADNHYQEGGHADSESRCVPAGLVGFDRGARVGSLPLVTAPAPCHFSRPMKSDVPPALIGRARHLLAQRLEHLRGHRHAPLAETREDTLDRVIDTV